MAHAWPIWDVQDFGPPLTCKAYRWRLPQKSGLRPSIRVFSEWTELRPVYQLFPLLTQRDLVSQADPATGAAFPGSLGHIAVVTPVVPHLQIFPSSKKTQEGEVNSYGWRLSSLNLPRFPCFFVSHWKVISWALRASRSPLALLVPTHSVVELHYTFIGIKGISYYKILVRFLWSPWHFTSNMWWRLQILFLGDFILITEVHAKPCTWNTCIYKRKGC